MLVAIAVVVFLGLYLNALFQFDTRAWFGTAALLAASYFFSGL